MRHAAGDERAGAGERPGALDGCVFPPVLNFPAISGETAPPVNVGVPALAAPPAGSALAGIAADYASQPQPDDQEMAGDAANGSGGSA